jgi:hypothetical protein
MAFACQPYAEPRPPLCMDKTFSPVQKGQIRDAYAAWNNALREYFGFDPVVDGGECEDADGFQVDDLNDSRHMVYNATKNAAYEEISRRLDMDQGVGLHQEFATAGDVLVFSFLVADEGECPDPTKTCGDISYDRQVFWALVAHGVGHYLGLMHVFEDDWAAMNMNAPSRVVSRIANADIRAACQWYECVKPPPQD